MPISVMLKPASGNCNLRCEYCFYHDLAATRQTENKGYMTRDTALQVMDNMDCVIADHLDAAHLATKPFTPLPVMGVPGWCAENENFSFCQNPR